jgi:hypothetical protein
MKKFLIILFALALTACAAPQAAPPVEQPSPVVVVNTVVVTAVPTDAPPTPIPSVTPLPPTATLAPTLPPPTEAPTQESAQPQEAASAAATTSGPIQIDPKFNGQSFEKITISGDKFSLNCKPREISFDVYSTNVYIVRTDLYIRIRDKHSTAPEPWALAGTMQTDGGNHFWMTLKGDQVKADLRKYQGWFDFQFVGVNKLGDVVDRSEKITDIVTYTINCQ